MTNADMLRAAQAIVPPADQGARRRRPAARPLAAIARRSDVLDLFWSMVDTSGGFDACWPWTGQTTGKGYGRFYIVDGGRRIGIYAHRLSFVIHNGELGPDEMACHTCDNPPCCNPLDLFRGTNQDNIQDAVDKGRAAHQTHPERVPRGERNGNARLSAEQVLQIRAMASDGDRYPVIARRFDVTRERIGQIVRGTGWAHVA